MTRDVWIGVWASLLLATLLSGARGFGQILIDDGSGAATAHSAVSGSSDPAGLSGDSQDDWDDSHADSVRTGKAAARSYFVAREEHEKAVRDGLDREPNSVSDSGSDHYLMVGFGTFLDDKAWAWGSPHENNVGSMMFNVTYRVSEWPNSMDLWFRAEYLTYNLTNGEAGQLGMMPIVVFPDARSNFPMYFGGGLGPGVFLRQISGSGDLALNYTVIAGVRFPNLFPRGGLFMESGYKGLVNLMSQGQQQGVYLTAGGVFVF